MKFKNHFFVTVFIYLFLSGSIFQPIYAQNADNTEIAEVCKQLEYIVPLFTYKGRPLNENHNRKITVLINHGYILGYSMELKQPLWSAYRVALVRSGTNYERPGFFHADLRLPQDKRIGPETFHGFDRGHLTPNAAINLQYGQLAQLETFLMSNICPQSEELNRGVWAKLEKRIYKNYAQAREEIWVINGPIFETPAGTVNGLEIPSHFFMIIVDVGSFPRFRPMIMAFKFSQQIDRKQEPDKKFLVSIDELERLTGLNFFPEFTASEEEKFESQAAGGVWPVQ